MQENTDAYSIVLIGFYTKRQTLTTEYLCGFKLIHTNFQTNVTRYGLRYSATNSLFKKKRLWSKLKK